MSENNVTINKHILSLIPPLIANSKTEFNIAKSLSWGVLLYKVEKSEVNTCLAFFYKN